MRKTAVTVALGSALSRVRGDRILAVDADPDGGNLADRAGRQSAATVSDLLELEGKKAQQPEPDEKTQQLSQEQNPNHQEK